MLGTMLAFVGDGVGTSVGAFVGENDAGCVGTFVGENVGDLVGFVGCFVGAGVGDLVGDDVGGLVGILFIKSMINLLFSIYVNDKSLLNHLGITI